MEELTIQPQVVAFLIIIAYIKMAFVTSTFFLTKVVVIKCESSLRAKAGTCRPLARTLYQLRQRGVRHPSTTEPLKCFWPFRRNFTLECICFFEFTLNRKLIFCILFINLSDCWINRGIHLTRERQFCRLTLRTAR